MIYRILALALTLSASVAKAEVVCNLIDLEQTPNSGVVTFLGLAKTQTPSATIGDANSWQALFYGAGANTLKLTEIKSTKSVFVDKSDFIQNGKSFLQQQFAVRFQLSSDQTLKYTWDETKNAYVAKNSISAYAICTQTTPK